MSWTSSKASSDDIVVDPTARFMENMSLALCNPTPDSGAQAIRFSKNNHIADVNQSGYDSEGKNFL